MLKFTLRGRIPSKKNSKKFIKRGGRRFLVSSDNYVAWHIDASNQLRKQLFLYLKNPNHLPFKKAKVNLLFYAPDHIRADLSNKAESVMDLLVDNGVLKDDNWFVCDDLSLKFGGVDKEDPRVEIELKS